MSAKFIAVYPVVTQHLWTSADVRKGIVGSIPTLASIFFKETKKPAHPATKKPVLSPDENVFAMLGGYLFRRGSRFKIKT